MFGSTTQSGSSDHVDVDPRRRRVDDGNSVAHRPVTTRSRSRARACASCTRSLTPAISRQSSTTTASTGSPLLHHDADDVGQVLLALDVVDSSTPSTPSRSLAASNAYTLELTSVISRSLSVASACSTILRHGAHLIAHDPAITSRGSGTLRAQQHGRRCRCRAVGDQRLHCGGRQQRRVTGRDDDGALDRRFAVARAPLRRERQEQGGRRVRCRPAWVGKPRSRRDRSA